MMWFFPPTESWFLPIDLECVRDHLVFIGIYIISTDEFSPLDSHCSTDRVHCLVEGEVKVIPQVCVCAISCSVLIRDRCVLNDGGSGVTTIIQT